MGKRYKYHKRTLYVKGYETVNHRSYAPFFVDAKGYERIFLLNGELIARSAEAEAQADLDEFARKRELAEVRE